jgi:hypothetical protein
VPPTTLKYLAYARLKPAQVLNAEFVETSVLNYLAEQMFLHEQLTGLSPQAMWFFNSSGFSGSRARNFTVSVGGGF